MVQKSKSNEVIRVRNLINGDAISSYFLISEMASASSTCVLVPLIEDFKRLLDIHLSSVAESADDAAIMKKKVLLWYSAVGGYLLYAVMLQQKHEILRNYGPFL